MGSGQQTVPAPAAPVSVMSPAGDAQPGYATAPALYPSAQSYGGFWIRVVAAIIDAIVVQVVVFPLSFIVGAIIGVAGVAVSMPGHGVQLVGVIVGAALGVGGSWLYEAWMESSSRQATLGKMVFNMKVTDLEGNRISFARATGRHFAKYLSGLILGIGYIMVGFTERKQGLHDMIVGTRVRRT
jgi:uncharacterized RDD family membrane protein YckC